MSAKAKGKKKMLIARSALMGIELSHERRHHIYGVAFLVVGHEGAHSLSRVPPLTSL